MLFRRVLFDLYTLLETIRFCQLLLLYNPSVMTSTPCVHTYVGVVTLRDFLPAGSPRVCTYSMS